MSGVAPDGNDQLAALEPAHLAAFSAFTRAPGEAERLATRELVAAARSHPSLNPSLARCVYAGDPGRIYIVPGPGSLGYVSIAADTRETVTGHTTTALAARSGLGHVRSGTDRPATFIGVLPTGGRDLRITDRANNEFRIRLTPDDAYWITVAHPIDWVWTRADGADHHPPLWTDKGRTNLRKAG